MANSKIIQYSEPGSTEPIHPIVEKDKLWTNPAYGLGNSVDLVTSWEDATAYVTRIY